MLASTSPQLDTGAQKPHREADKHLLRTLIQNAGLRSSMSRLKVTAALCDASARGRTQGVGVSGSELHQQLSRAGEPLCLASVRDVLRRLQQNGLVQRTGRDQYCLAPDVEDTLVAGYMDVTLA